MGRLRPGRTGHRHHRVAIAAPLVVASLALGLLVAPAVGPVAGPGAARAAREPGRTARPGLVAVYGDSALVQASSALTRRLERQGWRVQVNAFPGLALCDWMPDFDRVSRMLPTLVVFAMSGNVGLNGAEACSSGRGERASVYATDMRLTAAWWRARDVPVLWVDAPSPPDVGDDVVVPIMERVAAEYDQAFARATTALRGRDGSWPLRIPCTRAERRDGHCDPDGTVQARRALDDFHPCPVTDPRTEFTDWGRCPVYAGGIVRWVDGIAAATRP